MPEPALFSDDRFPDPTDVGGVFARVAVERAIGTHETLTYAAGELAVRVGDRVRAPLGRGNQPTPGVVTEVGGPELLDGFDPARVKRLLERSPSGLPDSLINLARWISRYYVCPLGMTLSAMVPGAVKAGVGERSVRVVDAVDDIALGGEPPERLPPQSAKAWEALAQQPGLLPMPAKQLARELGLSNAGPVNRLVALGLLRERDQRDIRARGDWTDRAPTIAPITTESLHHQLLTLSDAQASALDAIDASLGDHETFLLRGVTGSGKTEVYLRAIANTLERGQGAIVLVPEIALTPQTSTRFLKRFGTTTVAVLHSGLTSSERHREWTRLRAGDAKVVVGARSAIFAPIDPLGLIVIDEEHDSSYKQDQSPRYHARDVAIVRGSLERCPVVLGSATPSLESWANAKRGRSKLIELPDRVGGGRLPRVRLVDMRQERRERADDRRHHVLGPTLERALEKTLTSGGQAVLLINRRGFAGHIGCPRAACGWTLGCDSCSVRMVLHKDRTLPRGAYVRCHHCHAEKLLPDRCPDCGGPVRLLGAGTQRLEDELEAKFGTLDLGPHGPGLLRGQTFARIDADTMRTGRDYFRELDRFAKGELRLLAGTQMIAKGLDFPGVRLVGVLDADAGLTMPDFRATERTFQLVSQVAGRAGRSTDPGLVIVQTLDPETPALIHAAEHDYVAFAEEELELRSGAELPPAWRMARVVTRDKDPDKARAAARNVGEALRPMIGPALRVEGPMPCVLERIADYYRFGVELCAPDAGRLLGVLDALRAGDVIRSDASMAVDVDPVSLL